MIFRIQTILTGLLAFAISSCQTTDPQTRADRYGTVFGDEEYSFVVGSDSASLSIRDVAVIAETIGVYKRLNASESEKIRALAQSKLDGFVLAEMRRLEPQVRRKRAAVRSKFVAARAVAKTPGIRQKIDAEEQVALAKIEQEWRRSALKQVERKYGSNLAIPLRTRDRKAAVALTKVKDGKVQPPQTAFEIDGDVVGRGEGSVRHGNVEAKVIDEPVSID